MVGIAFLLLLSVQFVMGEECQLGWMKFEGLCYLFDKLTNEWQEAADKCYKLNAQLAEVNNTKLNTWLLEQIISQSIDNIWIGASSMFTNEKWAWVPRGRLFDTYQNWDEAEPNNPESEPCSLLNPSRQYKWTSENCNQLNSYICVKRRCGSVCEYGFHDFQEKCYSFRTDKVRWADAVAMCKRMGADIAEIDSPQLNTWLGEKAKYILYGNSWIGGSTLYIKGHWQWITSHQRINAFRNWHHLEPNNLDSEKCVYLATSTHGQWINAPCDWDIPFVCERKLIQ